MASRSRFIRQAQKSFCGLALFAPLCASPSATAQTNVKTQGHASAKTAARAASNASVLAIPQRVALAGSVPAAVANAINLGPMNGGQALSVLICFTFADPQAAQAYADAVSDPKSLLYRQWLTPQEVGQKFGPGPDDYAAMLNHIQANGLKVEETPVNRLTLRVSGSAAQIQQAFGVTINNYRESAADAIGARGADAIPYEFYAPSAPVQIPAELAGKISSIEGLETYTRPILRSRRAKFSLSSNFDAIQPRAGYDLANIYDALNATTANKPGTGRIIGVSNFVGVVTGTNATSFITHNSLPAPTAGAGSNVTRVTVNTASRGENGEGDLDFQMPLGQAPLATILIYDNGSNDLISVLAKEASDNRADVLTESYGWGLSAGTATSAHIQHTTMTMQGQTYLAASGDSGDIGGDSYQYPDYDPDVLIIGGTTLTVASGTNAYAGETGWSGSGGGSSALNTAATLNNVNYPNFNTLPVWQKGRNVPTGTNRRLSPDVAFHASGPNSGSGAYGFYYKNALNTGSIGTSFASPVTAGQIALLEQYLISQNALPANSAGKQRLGRLQDVLYAFNGRDDIFHDITTGGNSPALGTAPYWDYTTGWGSIDWGNFATALAAPLSVSIAPVSAALNQNQTVQLAATVTGSNVQKVTWTLFSGPGTISSSGVYTAPSTLTAPATAVAQATSVIDTANPGVTTASFQPNPVSAQVTITLQPAYHNLSGVVALEGISDPSLTVMPVNPVTFFFTPSGGGVSFTLTQTLGAGGSFAFSNLPAAYYALKIKGDKWLRVATSANLTVNDITNLSVSLLAGDATNDNSVDSTDFGILIGAYNGDAAISGSNYDPTADFNNDGLVDSTDFGLLINNFGLYGK